ncbi:MAG: hypothetical protein GQ564_08020 [Bacteroidales bacterium]|nr:hypothetical protein [Bacteroidales bacterium]
MKEARIYVDFNEMIEDNLVLLSKTDFTKDSKGNTIKLKEGLKVKVYSDDLSSCFEKDNLIADGVVELNTHGGWTKEVKWNCRINKAGIFNESDKIKK